MHYKNGRPAKNGDKVLLLPMKPNLLLKSLLCIALVVPVLLFLGCQLFGKNPAPPTAFDQKAFNIVTNVVYKIENVTNRVPVYETNYQVEVITITNAEKQVVQVFATNFIPLVTFSNLVVTVTNRVEQYDYTPNATTKNTAAVAGTLSNLGVPGIGSLVTALLVGAAGAYGKMRSTLKTSEKANEVLAQGVETAREVIYTTPQGAQLDAAFKNWLIQHQQSAGILGAVSEIVKDNVNSSAAQGAANLIKAQVDAAKQPPAPSGG